ncbi:MAG: cupin domain-containing protein [Ktedonobacteraceae bacterium]
MQTTHLFDAKKMELFPGIDAQIFAGKQVMVMRVVLEQDAIATAHAHPHEQISVVLQGEMEFTIGTEQKTLKVGDAVVIPGDVTHSAKAIVRSELLEVFNPVREDLVKRYSNV